MSPPTHTHYRIYIRNLDYLTTEEDLHTLFAKYDPVNILVPSYTVKFSRTGKHKPLGFAYVEFKSPTQVEDAVKEYDGTIFNGKKLIVKAYSPYTPSYKRMTFAKRYLKRNTTESNKGSGDDDDEGNEEEDAREVPVASQNKQEIDVASETNNNSTFNSKVSIYIPKARGEITESKVQEFFKDYDPSNILILKKKSKINPINLTGSHVSVLATVDTSKNKINDIIHTLKSQKLNGRKVDLKPIDQNKIDEFKREAELAAKKENQEKFIIESGNGTTEVESTESNDLPDTNEANISPSSNFDIAPPPNPTPENLTMSSNFTEPITSS
ncbi:RRT5 [Candida pseudojiufengensis]|uniref:RRT5 n=1 Tax=Candida pseudojiufengensis TaxID=497109 RepID=UPI0022250FD9|nr:RRT5 [Candida pseudojiufengensis]KAI5964888.1 RRT5 [Candida pseudojiufengensis]